MCSLVMRSAVAVCPLSALVLVKQMQQEQQLAALQGAVAPQQRQRAWSMALVPTPLMALLPILLMAVAGL